jgi:lipopolysaccharide/colanic/teichoic acid biosynthesis glycosyltransferase
MRLRKWADLPPEMKNQSVRGYFDILQRKRLELFLKRFFDLLAASIAFILLLPVLFVLSIAVKVDSNGPIFFCQERVTQYGKRFKIYKFRSMVPNAESIGPSITSNNDNRVTRIGYFLRRHRLDEFPQLINIIKGEMTFVGTRPEVARYVEKYSDEMMATLLLPAGATSEASILYKGEGALLDNSVEPDKTYLEVVLPEKMKYNLNSLQNFSILREFQLLFKTIAVVLRAK